LQAAMIQMGTLIAKNIINKLKKYPRYSIKEQITTFKESIQDFLMTTFLIKTARD
jgi:hypothetical protein